MGSLRFTEAVQEIEAALRLPGRRLSLAPVQTALKRLGLLERIDPERVVVVAGTNGKGTTCAMLEALLLSAGQDVALFTSPHLEHITERMRRGGRDIAEAEFLDAYLRVRPLVTELGLVHFEILTLVALTAWFAGQQSAPDWLLLEVGLGGTWDATNAVPHRTCGIARLGLDHVELLGGTLQSIARNKFGVVGPGARVVHTPFPEGPEGPAVAELARDHARTQGSRWTVARPCPVIEPAEPARAPRFFVDTPWGRVELPLPGARAAENSALALSLFEALGFDPDLHLGALAHVRWPGRMEQVEFPGARCPVHLSGDHNPQGVASLVDLLRHFERKRLWVVCGVARDKPLAEMLEPLLTLPGAQLLLTETPFKTRPLDEIPESYRTRAAGLFQDPREALRFALSRAQAEDRVLVTGSLYLVGLLRQGRSQG